MLAKNDEYILNKELFVIEGSITKLSNILFISFKYLYLECVIIAVGRSESDKTYFKLFFEMEFDNSKITWASSFK